jgi:Domain of unknown function (DUF4124)
MRIILLVLLLVPQLAAARVYMCVDPDTGRKSFTDRGCDQVALREEVRVDPANLDSGARTAVKSSQKTWLKDLDTRKTGRDYADERKGIYENNATAENNIIPADRPLVADR